MRLLIAAAAALAIGLPAVAAAAPTACMVGTSGDTLAAWLEKTGQQPVLYFHVATGKEPLPGILAMTPDGKFSFLIESDGMTCILAVGEAIPAKDTGSQK